MKISKTKLQQIIKEEASRLREEDPDQTIEVAPVKDKYSESRRLFDYFFGDWTMSALLSEIEHDIYLQEIVTQLYGWGLPEYKDKFEAPGTATIAMAQEFEKENKNIDGNEDEFLDRLEAQQYQKGKEMFAQAQAEAPYLQSRNVKASPRHIQKAIADLVRGEPSG